MGGCCLNQEYGVFIVRTGSSERGSWRVAKAK